MTDPYTIPELTRGLRSFAAPRSLGGLHDQFFTPMLAARRSAKLANGWTSRMSAFDAARLDAALRATLEAFAAERFPKSPPDRRALAAELEDACQDVFARLGELKGAQAAVVAAGSDDERRAPWEVWVNTLRLTFAAADRGWERMRDVLQG